MSLHDHHTLSHSKPTSVHGSYGNFKRHALGGVAQHLSYGLNLCALMHILRSKVVWVGFHIFNIIVINKVMKGCEGTSHETHLEHGLQHFW
jgi:hypothetical protein